MLLNTATARARADYPPERRGLGLQLLQQQEHLRRVPGVRRRELRLREGRREGAERLVVGLTQVFVDYLRNVRGANAVAAYSTRARESAPVAVPVDWDELDRLSGATDFTVAEVPLRVLGFAAGHPADPWARYLACRQRIPESLTRDLAATS